MTERFSQEELRAAFEKVENRDHWKNPIDAFCRVDEEQVVSDAVIHFTGSVPRFQPMGNGWSRVTAAGYYATIGA